VLSEAQRINKKHLLTLEPGISEFQTTEMHDQNLQLVVPSPLHNTYSETQRRWIFTLSDFIRLIKDKQGKFPKHH
jgi:hypothetical protein